MTETQATRSPENSTAASSVQRLLMDRALAHAARDGQKPPRRPVPMIVGFLLALGVVLTIAIGFDKFLASMQRFMHVYDEQDRQEEVERAKQPMPAFVVPESGAEQAATQPAASQDGSR